MIIHKKIWKIVRWAIIFSLLYTTALLFTLPADLVVRGLRERVVLPFSIDAVEGYLWKGRGVLQIFPNQDPITLTWHSCLVAAAPYLGWCWTMEAAENQLQGSLVTLDGRNLYGREIHGQFAINWLLRQLPQKRLSELLDLQAEVTVTLSHLHLVRGFPQAWDGTVDVRAVTINDQLLLDQLMVRLRNRRLPQERRTAIANLLNNHSPVPSFAVEGNGVSLRMNGEGYILPDRHYHSTLNFHSTDAEIQNGLRLFAQPLGNNQFRWRTEGKF